MHCCGPITWTQPGTSLPPLALQAASDGPDGRSHTCSITAGLLEVAEHLPFPSQPSPDSSAASLFSFCGWLPAEEMARVPAVLPAVRHLHWPAPTSAGGPSCFGRQARQALLLVVGASSLACMLGGHAKRMLVPHGAPFLCFTPSVGCPQSRITTRSLKAPPEPLCRGAGDYPLPEPAGGLGLGDTLAQLSDLSQATVYQSATMVEVGCSAALGGWAATWRCLKGPVL